MSSVRQIRLADVVVDYYESKTQAILRKYGPGPRVHFHTGLVHDVVPFDAWPLSRALHEAQERLLRHVVERAPKPLIGTLLDVGCGMGGTALFLAEAGATVQGITVVPSHVRIARELARAAGLGARTSFRVEDAHVVRGTYDHAVAIESSCYLERARWLARMAGVLRRGGTLHIVDCMVGDPSVAPQFDAYWRTTIGPLDEYVAAAEGAGFRVIEVEALGNPAAGFWRLSRAWTVANLPDDAVRQRSLAEHRLLESAFLSGAIQYLRVVLERT